LCDVVRHDTCNTSGPAWHHMALAVAVASYALFFSLYQMHYHQAFWSGLDLISVQQPIWNTLHGHFMRATYFPFTGEPISNFPRPRYESLFADHVQPTLLVLTVPYALVPRSEVFGVVLSVSVALGALPLYSIARRRLGSESWALLFAVGYLLLPAVETTSGWDIHGTGFLPPLLLAALDAAQRGRRRWWWLWSILAMGCREDIPFLVGWAMLWLAPREQRRDAIAMAIVGTIWSLTSFLGIVPHFGAAGTPYLGRFLPPGTELSMAGIITATTTATFWLQTLKHFVTYNLRLGLPLLFLFWFHSPALLAMAPQLVLNSLSWYDPARYPELSHYSLPLIPWALLGTVEGFVELERRLGRWRPLHWRGLIGEALAASVIGAHIVSGYTPLSLSFVWPAKTGREPMIQTLLRQIPDNAPISAEMHLAAHLAARETLRLFPDLRDAEWIVIDAWFGGDPYGGFVNTWQRILQDPTWETVAAHDGLILLRKGMGPPRAIEEAFQPSGTLVLPPLDAQFGRTEDGLQLRGLNIYCRAAGLCYLCLEGIKTGTSPLIPQVAVIINEETVHRSQMQATSIAPRVYVQPGALQDCVQILTERSGLHRLTLELSVMNATDQRLPVTLQDPGHWGDQVRVQKSALSILPDGKR